MARCSSATVTPRASRPEPPICSSSDSDADMWRTIREPAPLSHQPRRPQPPLWPLDGRGRESYLRLARSMRHPPARQWPDDQLRLPGHHRARRDGSLQRGPRVDDRLSPDDRARRGHGVAPDLDAIAEQGAELAQAGIQARAVRMADRYRSRHDLEVRQPGPGAQVDVVPQDRVPDVSEVRRPGAIQ